MIICATIKKRTSIALGIVSGIILVMLYSWMSHEQHQKNPNDKSIPNLTQFKQGLVKITTPDAMGHIWIIDDSLATGKRLFLGLGISVFCGSIVGILMGCFKPFGAFMMPPLVFLNKIAPTACITLYYVLFGLELEFFLAMVSVGVFLNLAVTTYTNVDKDVNVDLIYKAYTLGATSMEVIQQYILPQIMPRMLQNIQSMIGPAIIFLMAAECALADVGFGYRIALHSRMTNMNVVFIYLAIQGGFGLFMDWLLKFIRQRMAPWYGE